MANFMTSSIHLFISFFYLFVEMLNSKSQHFGWLGTAVKLIPHSKHSRYFFLHTLWNPFMTFGSLAYLMFQEKALKKTWTLTSTTAHVWDRCPLRSHVFMLNRAQTVRGWERSSLPHSPARTVVSAQHPYAFPGSTLRDRGTLITGPG